MSQYSFSVLILTQLVKQLTANHVFGRHYLYSGFRIFRKLNHNTVAIYWTRRNVSKYDMKVGFKMLSGHMIWQWMEPIQNQQRSKIECYRDLIRLIEPQSQTPMTSHELESINLKIFFLFLWLLLPTSQQRPKLHDSLCTPGFVIMHWQALSLHTNFQDVWTRARRIGWTVEGRLCKMLWHGHKTSECRKSGLFKLGISISICSPPSNCFTPLQSQSQTDSKRGHDRCAQAHRFGAYDDSAASQPSISSPEGVAWRVARESTFGTAVITMPQAIRW